MNKKADYRYNISNNYSYFMDIGFAPGGMSQLLLDCNKSTYGIGITLPPEDKGNAYAIELETQHNRYSVKEHDICILSKQVKNKLDFMKICNMPPGYVYLCVQCVQCVFLCLFVCLFILMPYIYFGLYVVS